MALAQLGNSTMPCPYASMTFAASLPFSGPSPKPHPNSNSNPKSLKSLDQKQIISLLQRSKHINQVLPIHAQLIRNGHSQDPFMVFELLRSCSKCHAIDYASRIFQYTHNPNVYLYTALIDGFVSSGNYFDAIQLYSRMLHDSILPDNYLMASILKACGSQLALREGREVHSRALKLGLSSNRLVRLRIMELYGKCGELGDARRVFEEMPEDVVASTVMISSYSDQGLVEEAGAVFSRVRRKDTGNARENVRPNEFTIVCVLSACSQLGALEIGRWVHSYMRKFEIELNLFVGNALINMYSRCGSIDEAQTVFDEMKDRDVITYNTMISGLSMNGKSRQAIELFRIEHYGCMVDLLGRVGRLEEAYDLIRTMKMTPDHIMLGTLLSACKMHKNLELGEQVAKVLEDRGQADSGTYVLLSHVYASSGKWKEAAQVRAKMKEAGMQKEPGCSSIEVNNEIHEFLLGDLRHPRKERIYEKLEELNRLLRLEGYHPEKEVVLQDIEDGEKEWALAIHSERLAICYGLISTEPCTVIRVMKNLRVCYDCHSAIKLIAKITRRKVVVRDRNRFHYFENGACSCGDYW
ncbi:putative pentatricopeptide repeat-containing protein, chloroplastic [Vitis vinifera]|uniref:Putative pentatricopeptide repeat-containing protein, chloroplastic n=1 Tax=Vitis vinifera TaxID=29760 RepID=A0A438KPY7_VITVI|nr:putative pentatricopeptide repeat-containing protein, chloroplastic [Vitis vinifera]